MRKSQNVVALLQNFSKYRGRAKKIGIQAADNFTHQGSIADILSNY